MTTYIKHLGFGMLFTAENEQRAEIIGLNERKVASVIYKHFSTWNGEEGIAGTHPAQCSWDQGSPEAARQETAHGKRQSIHTRDQLAQRHRGC